MWALKLEQSNTSLNVTMSNIFTFAFFQTIAYFFI